MSKSFRAPLLLLTLLASAVGTSFAFNTVPGAEADSSPAAEAAAATPPAPRPEQEAGEMDPPVVWIDYTSPTFSPTATIVINYCDDVSMVSSSRFLSVNGAVVSTGYTAGSYGGCTVYATSTVVVNLNMGSNALYAKIRGDNFEWGEAYATIVRQAPPPLTFRVTAIPDGAVVSKAASTASTQWFKITNSSSVATTFQLSASCAGAGIASGCSLSSSSKLIASSVTDSVYVSFTTGSAGTVGRIDLTADSGAVVDDAYVTINVPAATPAANYPVVDLSKAHSGTTVERSACLTISVGSNAAYECGDLRLTHALPTVTTLNKSRAPTLIYSSMHNRPYPIVAADVSVPSGSAGVPDSVTAALSINGTPVNSGKWTGSAWSVGGLARRIGIGYDASLTGTGVKSYSLEVAFFIGGTRYATTKTGDLTVVDRRASEFGAGWWLAGLEQLFFVSGGRVLWVGGDGSTRVYTNAGLVPSTGTRRWVAPDFSRPDSMFHDTTSGNYTRHHSGGVRVVFNSAGQHISTINRLGHTTAFARTGARLDSIVVPPASAGMVYRFSYTGSSRLSSIAVRGPTSGSTRTMTVTDSGGVVKTIRDPGDTVSVTFSYVSSSNTNVRGRKDRTGHWNLYVYDTWNRLSQVHDTIGAQLRVDTLVAAESRAQPGQASLRTDSALTRHNGPRNDVADAADVTQFLVDPFGAPTWIKNALGHVTLIDRADIRWPGRATRVRQANGRAIVSFYDKRGNVRSVTDSSSVHNSRYAVTRYNWDAKWDRFTMAVSAEGVITKVAYDTSNGNRLWQEDGRGATSRVNFTYWTTGIEAGLLRSTELPGAIKDTVKYDAVLGNFAVSKTPMGYQVKLTRDSIGRVVTKRTQIDTASSIDVLAEEQRFTYDLRDLVVSSVSYGPPKSGVDSQKVIVESAYDDERRAILVRRRSDPDPSSIEWISTSWKYDAVGRRFVEIAGDGAVDTTYYGPAGLVDSTRTRRGHKLRFKYDAVGQLTERKADSVAYPVQSNGIAGWAFDPSENTSYPRLLTNGAGGMTVARDSASFSYDAVGNILTAENVDARVQRTWATNGSLTSEVQKVQTYLRNDWTKHVYSTYYYYDLDGRRTRIKYPSQLAPASGDSINFTYDSLTGAFTRVRDLVGNDFQFTYGVRNELTTRRVIGSSLIDAYAYDLDGKLRLHMTYDSTADAEWFHEGTVVRRDSLWYDARGKVVQTRNNEGIVDRLTVAYSGLGHVVNSASSDYALWYRNGLAWQATAAETFSLDALGNVKRDSSLTGNLNFPNMSSTSTTRVRAFNSNGTGRLASDHLGYRKDTVNYDPAGNQEFVTYAGSVSSPNNAVDNASYYDAVGRLVAVDQRTAKAGVGFPSQWKFVFTFDEYRYDALGRRVLVRSRQSCNAPPRPSECTLGLIRRTVWSGAQEIGEIQMPGADTVSATILENDVDTIPHLAYMDGDDLWDQNPFFGGIAYTFGLTLDVPLSITRLDYVDKAYSRPVKRWPTFAIIPHWNWRGAADNTSFADGPGGIADGPALMCTGTGTWDPGDTLRCVGFSWPYGMLSYGRPSYTPQAWYGTLVDQKRDATGTMYRRHRYFSPATSRFTQEDPIGLVGGMNVYGYGAGDPVNNSDPFGLMTLEVIGEKLRKAIEEERKRNPRADSAFRKLEESSKHYVMFDSDETACDVCYGSGWAWDSEDSIGLPGTVGTRFTGARGVAHVRPSHNATVRDGVGSVAWHEAVHLTGIEDRSKKYVHCEPAFLGVSGGCPKN